MDTGPVPVHIEAAPKFCHFEKLAQIGVQLTKPDDNAPHYITSAGDWLDMGLVGCVEWAL